MSQELAQICSRELRERHAIFFRTEVAKRACRLYMAGRNHVLVVMPDLPTGSLAMKTRGTSSFGVLLTLGLSTPPPPWYQGKRFTTAAERKHFYASELTRVLASLHATSPRVPVTVFTDQNETSVPLPPGVTRRPLHTKAIRESGEIIYALSHSPYERSLIMDLDVTVCSDLMHTFDFLTDFDAAFVIEPPAPKPRPMHVPGCSRKGPFNGCLTRIEANLGFFMLRRNPRTTELLDLWKRRHAKDGRSAQNALGIVLAQQSKVRFLPLPVEYNLRVNGAKAPLLAAGRVVVLHARGRTCSLVDGDEPRVLHPLPRPRSREIGALTVPQTIAAMLAAVQPPEAHRIGVKSSKDNRNRTSQGLGRVRRVRKNAS